MQSAYLVVDVLKDTDQTAGESNSLVGIGGLPFGHIVVFLRHDLLDDISSLLEKDTDQLVILLSACDPRVLRHRDEVLGIVESGGDKGKVDTDLLIRCVRNLE